MAQASALLSGDDVGENGLSVHCGPWTRCTLCGYHALGPVPVIERLLEFWWGATLTDSSVAGGTSPNFLEIKMDTNESYEKLTLRSERLLKFVRSGAPMEIIFNEIKLLHKIMPEFEESYIKWANMQAKDAIQECRNNRGLCAECPEELKADELKWCKVCLNKHV